MDDTIFRAAAERDMPALKRFVEVEQTDLALKDGDERTVLHWAAAAGWADGVEYLLCSAEGLNPFTVDDSGWTPLMSAASGGHGVIVERLIERMKEEEQIWESKEGKTALERKRKKRMKVEVMVNAVNDSGRSALHYAASKHHCGVIQLLLEHGAAIDLPDHLGYTPFHRACCAIDNKPWDAFQILIDAGASVTARTHVVESVSHLKKLIDLGADADSLDRAGMKPGDHMTKKLMEAYIAERNAQQ